VSWIPASVNNNQRSPAGVRTGCSIKNVLNSGYY
jgi:hypothetical protein